MVIKTISAYQIPEQSVFRAHLLQMIHNSYSKMKNIGQVVFTIQSGGWDCLYAANLRKSETFLISSDTSEGLSLLYYQICE